MTQLTSMVVPKGWGEEVIFDSNDLYCGKLLKFNKSSKFSMHFHMKKTETWYVLSGSFLLNLIDTKNADISTLKLEPGMTIRLLPGVPHQLESLGEGTILEVSTKDSVEDNYRVAKGDSQTKI